MSQSINTNMAALSAQRHLQATQSSLATSMERLSSGLRVNSAKDDAAGIAIASRMEAQIRGQNVAIRNANDAISLTQTAEGAIGKVSDMLQRMRELAVQSANVTNTTADRTNLDAEFQQLNSEIVRTVQSTRFNGIAVIGSQAGGQSFQVGDKFSDQITVTTANLDSTTTLTAIRSNAITTAGAASTAMANIDDALSTVNAERAVYGAVQNRFEAIVSTLQVSVANNAAARGRILDADFATETANMSRAQILQQAGTAMLAQANQAPQQVLQLLRG